VAILYSREFQCTEFHEYIEGGGQWQCCTVGNFSAQKSVNINKKNVYK
jgi:hypothetical protein